EVRVEPRLDDVALGGRQALLELLRLHLVRERREVDPIDAEARRAERREHADRRAHVVAAPEGAAHVARPNADRDEDRLVARLGQPEALSDEAREGGEAVAGNEERDRRLEGRRGRELLEDWGATDEGRRR